MATAETSIGVMGGGYVGLVSGACFSSLGFQVTIVESDPAKLASLKNGKMPIYEPGLSELVHEGLASGRLQFVPSVKELFQKSVEVVFIAVGTPQNADGSCNLEYVNGAVKSVVETGKGDLVLVLKSTVPVGTARKFKDEFESHSGARRLAVVNNPEFLTEGNAIANFMRPDRVVIGGSAPWALDKVKALYESLLNNGHPLFVVDHETAELSKLAANLMLASRISLINQVSRLSARVGADVRQIESVLRSDPRIGPHYLYSGLGYGGSCFPKDVKSFVKQCEDHGVDALMARSVDAFNSSQKLFLVDEIRKRFPNARDTTVTLLGTAFKPNTDDIRESPALAMTLKLREYGYRLKVYDPRASANYSEWLRSTGIDGVEVCQSPQEALGGSHAMVLVTEWPEFLRLGPVTLKGIFKGKTIFDGKNTLKPQGFKDAGFEYVGVGRN